MSPKQGLISHIEIYVSNLAKSKEFWGFLLEKYLNYTKFQEWDKGISWKLDETYIVFVQTQDKYLDISYHRSRTGLNHLAFHIDTKDQLDAIVHELEMRGQKILYNDRFRKEETDDPYSIFFEDPDRIKVELVVPS